MGRYLGIDVGTESVRASLFDEHGRSLGTHRSALRTVFPRPAWAEQDPEQWWSAVVESVSGALAQAGTTSVDTIAVATTSSSVAFLDEDGAPVHPAILWMDQRAAEEAAHSSRTDHPDLAYAGGGNSAEWLVTKAAWMARNRPDVWGRTARVRECHDYLVERLTGRAFASRMMAACKWNVVGDGYPSDLYALLGAPGLESKLPETVLPVGAAAAEVAPAVARELGIDGAPVVGIGGIDAHLSLVSLGELRHAAGGPLYSMVAGTSNALTLEVDEPLFDSRFWGPYPNALSQGRYLVEAGQVTTGSVLSWAAERLFGISREDLPSLLEQVERIPTASHGIIALDTFMGGRTPWRDATMRGGFLGLSLQTGPAELYRSLAEAVALGSRAVVDGLTESGIPEPGLFAVSGGITRNPLWLQLTVDAINREIAVVRDDNLTLRSCALIGHRLTQGDTPAPQFAPPVEMARPREADAAALAEAYHDYVAAQACVAGLREQTAARRSDASDGTASMVSEETI
ncbi:FGGY family carbohydrate kinase [Leucobacter ruminantium]|uniref:Sugar kinase n=1 Tax=Leucobacter ruminantium TaxID=1289170 RepID=A0A939LVU2_9MICO|nr:sugar kinase [Leucobacter ruminantium]